MAVIKLDNYSKNGEICITRDDKPISSFFHYKNPIPGTKKSEHFPIVQQFEEDYSDAILFIESQSKEGNIAYDRMYHLALRYAKSQLLEEAEDKLIVNHDCAHSRKGQILTPPFRFNPGKQEIFDMTPAKLINTLDKVLESK